MVNDTLISVTPVPDHLMEPGLEVGEWLLVDKLSPKLYHWNREDVVLLRSPFKPAEKSVRRIKALENDWLFHKATAEGAYVKMGHCWIEGDAPHPHEEVINQRASPTLCGPVPLALITGRATHVIWPPSRVRKVW
eukprot:CAMPEP_0196596744 /NCGR_PEP_ID=MMETSP1081-20130531/87649_1 /TAXON_ID=36882 /ORGANISM="Pyramimonas amylifera, Strain CCMP720" /LENGTH=134 /DNA_ID=CAMNT_0041921877 /DNA_START=362 /DNA_END=763 /DNA_ORIENTATION=+